MPSTCHDCTRFVKTYRQPHVAQLYRPAYCCGCSCKQSHVGWPRNNLCSLISEVICASITNIHVYLLLFKTFKSVQIAFHCYQCTTVLGNVTCDPHCVKVCTNLPFLGVTWFVFCHDVRMFVLSGHVTVASFSRSHGWFVHWEYSHNPPAMRQIRL
jgi:hypothetical protein